MRPPFDDTIIGIGAFTTAAVAREHSAAPEPTILDIQKRERRDDLDRVSVETRGFNVAVEVVAAKVFPEYNRQNVVFVARMGGDL